MQHLQGSAHETEELLSDAFSFGARIRSEFTTKVS